jgi:hypothetical protein
MPEYQMEKCKHEIKSFFQPEYPSNADNSERRQGPKVKGHGMVAGITNTTQEFHTQRHFLVEGANNNRPRTITKVDG